MNVPPGSTNPESKTMMLRAAAPAVPGELSVDRIAQILATVPFLKGLKIERLRELVTNAFLRRYNDGEAPIVQGDYGHTLFVLLTGAIRVEAVADNGQVLKLARFDKPGTYFGELAVLGRARRSATTIAEGTASLLEVEKTKLEKLDKELGGKILEEIHRLSQVRAISNFLGQHRAFSELDDAGRRLITDGAQLTIHPRGTTIYAEGDLADNILIIKSGVAKLVKQEDNSVAVLAYFNSGDVVGLSDGIRRHGSLVSMGYVEVITSSRIQFERLKNFRPGFFDQFKKAEMDRSTRAGGLTAPPPGAGAGNMPDVDDAKTVFDFVDALVVEGAQEAQSLLTIDLNLCVRCGNCVRACEARHGFARMTRRGKKLVRREKLEVQGEYQNILLPSSCRHCVNPECMIGCPTGAIHRLASGEVDIHSFCIGCSSCANRCPWDNITMIPTPGRLVNGAEMKQLATKCNLCAGYEDSNCVENCPTSAILRIEPTTYFKEVGALLGKGVNKAIGGKRTEEAKDEGSSLAPKLVPIVALILALAVGAIAWSAPVRFVTYSRHGFALGWIATSFMLAAVALGGRRRLARFRTQLGSYKLWANAHFYLGGLALLAVFLHAGFRFGGFVTTLLMLVLLLEVITGLFGIVYYRWLPKVITRIEGDSQVEEDLLAERRTLGRRRGELLDGASDALAATASRLRAVRPGLRATYSRAYKSAEVQARLLDALSAQVAALSAEESQTLERLALDAVRLGEIRAALLLYTVRRSWLVSHIGVSAALLTLMALHIVSVFWF
jgi:Fe-S-cluster-containing dehydrogenase component/CRP-like cAMP-binding protein